uniref:SET domain-containing protein n=1 Tax=Taeniopygia guttata TaxID=59729 RepID=A0A674GZD2_TAEGU
MSTTLDDVTNHWAHPTLDDGIGCYMFRIDEAEVVDATMHGSAARFINHSCEPNCYSRVIHVEGHKRIVIFALRRILRGEELTYDYKFPIEEPAAKLPCNCGARRCRRQREGPKNQENEILGQPEGPKNQENEISGRSRSS